jgi:hypothetical protein
LKSIALCGTFHFVLKIVSAIFKKDDVPPKGSKNGDAVFAIPPQTLGFLALSL